MEFTPDGPMAIPLWINGHAFLTASQDFLDVVNPVTGQALRRVPLCGAAEAAEALAAARAAQPGWQALPEAARAAALQALAGALERYAGHFAKLLVQDRGLDEAAASGEVEAALAALRDASPGTPGCLGLVVDAGAPLANLARCLAPAALAGATLVVKPSPRAPSAVFALCELATRADWPDGVLNVLQGDTAAIEGLCAAAPDRLLFAGDPALGEQVLQLAARAGVHASLVAA